MEENDALAALAALAQPLRLRVFRALVVAGPQGLTPGELAARWHVPANTLSFHLKELLRSGLITQERDGRSLICRAGFEHMTALLGYLSEHCCQGQPQPGCPAPALCGAQDCGDPPPTMKAAP